MTKKLFNSIGFVNPDIMIHNRRICYQTMFWIENNDYGMLITIIYIGGSKWRIITDTTGYGDVTYDNLSYSDVMEILKYIRKFI